MLSLAAAVLAYLSCMVHAEVNTSSNYDTSTTLANLALHKVLNDAAPIFGVYQNTQSNTSNWMEKYPDDTLIVHMNIPGTHDVQTWNYSLALQQELDHVTALGGLAEYVPAWVKTQDRSPRRMLDDGIRVFDLRYAFDETNTTLVFWHDQDLFSETATVEDVLFGFWQWLDDHPSEAIFLSFQYEGGTTLYASDDAAVQMALYNTLTSSASEKYFVQTKNELGTLGEARGKATLFRRFDLDLLPASYQASLPGIHFSPNDWITNSPNITLVYNTDGNLTAYMEDYYAIGTPQGSGAAENIQWKLNATMAHINMATTQHPDSLFWTFASSEHDTNAPPDWPQIMAIGNGTKYTPSGGVNQQILPFLQKQKGKRVGIVMFDFYEHPSDLVNTLLDL